MPRADPKKSYHHGDLRDALVAAAEQLMSEQASWTFTLREVARVAGVSHNAPYNHFPDRRALLAAVAARGFDALTTALRLELGRVDAEDVPSGIQATAQAYVAYAIAHPSRYRLMFSAELAGHEDAVLRSAGEGAFVVLRDLIAKGVSAGQLRGDPHATHALTAWSLVHGLGTLALDGKLKLAQDGVALEALTDIVSATLVDGLATRPRPVDGRPGKPFAARAASTT